VNPPFDVRLTLLWFFKKLGFPLADLWSLGTIFGELLYRKPLLNGDNFVNQLEKINDFLGTPSTDDLWYEAPSNTTVGLYCINKDATPSPPQHVSSVLFSRVLGS
jgi:hypothetical protein